MCLDQLKEFPVETDKGYKVFYYDRNDQLWPVYFRNSHSQGYPFRIRTWHKAKPDHVRCPGTGSYLSGFHLFLSKDDAIKYADDQFGCLGCLVVYRVQFKDVLATGYHDGMQTVVADQIIVLDEVAA